MAGSWPNCLGSRDLPVGLTECSPVSARYLRERDLCTCTADVERSHLDRLDLMFVEGGLSPLRCP